MNEDSLCMKSWKKALDNLPKANLTPAEMVQKTEYQEGFETVVNAIKEVSVLKLQEHFITIVAPHTLCDHNELPWVKCAREILPQRIAKGDYTSSVRSSCLSHSQILTFP